MGMRYKDYAEKNLDELEIRVEELHRRTMNNSITPKEFDDIMERIKFIVANLKQVVDNEDAFMTN